MSGILPDLMALVGIGCVTYGSYLISVPTGWIVGGSVLALLGLIRGYIDARRAD